jgi:hypothetical protein
MIKRVIVPHVAMEWLDDVEVWRQQAMPGATRLGPLCHLLIAIEEYSTRERDRYKALIARREAVSP